MSRRLAPFVSQRRMQWHFSCRLALLVILCVVACASARPLSAPSSASALQDWPFVAGVPGLIDDAAQRLDLPVKAHASKSCKGFVALLSTKDLLKKCSTVVLSSPVAAAELKGDLSSATDRSSQINDLILEDSYISSGWVTVYHERAPYLEHNSHIHVRCAELTYARVTKNPDKRLSPSLCFWENKALAAAGTPAYFCVYFPPFCDWSQRPCTPRPENIEWFEKWVKEHGTEFDMA